MFLKFVFLKKKTCNSLIFLIHELFEITHLESMFHLRRNQVVHLHKQKLRTVPKWDFK